MGLRSRALIAVTLVVACVCVILVFVVSLIVAKSLRTMELQAVDASLAQATEALELHSAQLERTAKDWATWDDTYQFMTQGDTHYVRSNLSGTALSALGVDFMVFMDARGNVVQALLADPDAGIVDRLPGGLAAYLSDIVVERVNAPGTQAESGVLALPDGAAHIAMQPILRSDGSGPPAGLFAVGEYLGGDELDELRRVVSDSVELYSPENDDMPDAWAELVAGENVVVEHVSPTLLRGYRLVRGMNGTPAFMIEISLPRTSMLLAKRTGTAVFWVLAVVAIVLVITISIAMSDVLIARLERLSSDVRRIARRGDFSSRVAVSGTDEISSLARDINTMLTALQASEGELRFIAGHDVLTGLTNRRQFERELEREVEENRRLGGSGAVLWFDLDNFKHVNDSLGHVAGDELLCAVARTLEAETRRYSTLARLGGDEFAMIIPHVSEQDAYAAASRMVSAVGNELYLISNYPVRVSMSAGVAMYPMHGQTVDELLVSADLAMYHAKGNGGAHASLHTAALHEALAERMKWGERVNLAIAENRLLLHGQPIVGLGDGEVVAYELLLRMVDEEGHLIHASQFVPAVEYLGLMHQLDEWVVCEAVRLLKTETDAGRDTAFTVNISAAGVGDPRLLETIHSAIEEADVDASRLIFEITETAAIADFALAQQFIELLRGLGCRFALDDFGTGTASFHYLKHLLVDYLKIDGSIVSGIGTNKSDAYFVHAIVDMCKGLEVMTIAESIEDEEILARVREVGVDLGQGWHIGGPGPLPGHEAREPVDLREEPDFSAEAATA